MTYAPDDLLAVRRYLLQRLDMHPGQTVGSDLDPAEVGIVGDPAHAATGGYHIGNDQLAAAGRLTSDYSKRESPRDRPGSNAASALDIGEFNRDGLTLPVLSVGVVEACHAGDLRCRDIREVIYSPDGERVLRWDALGIRSSGDASHLFHTHVSFFRDSEGRRAALDNVLGLLEELIDGNPTTAVGDDMGNSWTEPLTQGSPGYAGHQRDTALAFAWQAAGEAAAGVRRVEDQLAAAGAADAKRDAAVLAAIQALAAGGTSVDTAAVIARIDASAAAESRAVAALQDRVADLVRQLAERDQRLAEALAAAPDAGAGRA